MSKRRAIAALLVATAAITAGCSSGGGSGSTPNTLLAVTGRTITAGQDLAFVFSPEAGKLVTISVQANSDMADPNFRVVRGEVDFEDLDDTPISDLVMIGADQNSGQEIGNFTPEAAGPYTLFVSDGNNWPDATFSITVTQQR